MYDYDDIDRALFSLELEEAPLELRASILAATVEAPREVVLARPFSRVDLGLAGAFLTAAICLSVGVLRAHGLPWLDASMRTLFVQLTSPTVLAWIGVGASTAIWLSLANLTPRLAGVPSSRA